MSSEWESAVKKLTALTREGKLKWTPTYELSERRRSQYRLVGPAYIGDTNNKRIAVLEYEFARFDLDGNEYPDTGISIEFIDPRWETEWVWPASGGRFELLEAIRFQTSQADKFLENFLHEPASAGST